MDTPRFDAVVPFDVRRRCTVSSRHVVVPRWCAMLACNADMPCQCVTPVGNMACRFGVENRCNVPSRATTYHCSGDC